MTLQFPSLAELETKKNEIEGVLNDVQKQLAKAYPNLFSLIITTSSTFNSKEEKVLSYALYLSFEKKNGFSYRLMEINCINPDGGFPVQVIGFLAPSVYFGNAETKDELMTKIQDVFNHPRTRTILSNNL